MNIKTHLMLMTFFNCCCFILIVVFIIVTKIEFKDYDLDDLLLVSLFRLGIILIVQTSGNLFLKALPIRAPIFLPPMPLPKDKDKDRDK